MRVKNVMTPEVVTVRPDASLREAAMLMVEHRISGLPVVDRGGRLLGVLSEEDLLYKEQGEPDAPAWLAWLIDPLSVSARAKLDARIVAEAMSAPAQTIGPDRLVTAAARLMLGAGIERLPVVVAGRVVGIVTRADLVRAFARSDAEIACEIREDVLRRSMMLEQGSVLVDVTDGEVSLTGTLETPEDAAVLPKLVARVPGVVGVRTELTAGVSRRTVGKSAAMPTISAGKYEP